MPPKLDHPCFVPPEDQNVPVWRYMDFSKFVSFLASKTLFFCRADRFDDPYEGATSHANSTLRADVYKDANIPTHAFEELSKYNEWSRQWYYVNCWHMNAGESAAMWKLYAQTNEAVAIQSTFLKLHASLPDDAFVGVVHYIDYEKDWMPEGNTFWPLVHKRTSFEHEREVRAVIVDLPITDNKIERTRSNSLPGRSVEVVPEKLIEKVYVAPTAPRWFADLVGEVTKKYGYPFPVQQSNLTKAPVF